MKICRIGVPGAERPAVIDDEGIARDVSSLIADWTPETLLDGIEIVRSTDVASLPRISGPLRYAPPVARIGKMIGVGLNYRKHAEESGMGVPSEPPFFLKATSAIVGADDDVVLPRGAVKGDWEVELGVVIGKPARYVGEDQAMDHVLGYCIVNDVSERELQLERGSQWTRGKSCDTFGPTGPWCVTADEIADPHRLRMTLRLNGETVQDGRTDDMVFSIPQLIAHLSTIFTLQPGDVISTGTPSGVGLGMNPQRFLVPGDEMHLAIDGLGEQQQKVVAYE